MTPEIPFKRNVVEPMECIKAGWQLVKPHYWLFVGMSLIAMLIGSAVPMGILLGPMMCGVYLTLIRIRRREPIEFATLFKGFDYFGPALIATLLHMLPVMAIIIPTYILFYASLVVTMAAQGDNPEPWGVLAVMGTFSVIVLVIVVIMIVISIGFTFAYPLIVDRKLPGFDAVKLSFKAAMANFWRLLGMVLVTSLMSALGLALCYVGMFLVFPVYYAAIIAAYEQVFGLSDPRDFGSNLPPPPPVFE